MKLKSLFLDNLTTKQTIFKNTFWLMFAEIISKAPVFLLTIWIIRYLGAKNYGKFTFAFAFGSLFTIFTDFGLSTLTIRDVAKNKSQAKKYIDNLLVLKLILSFVTLILIFSAIQFLGKSPEVKALVCFVAIFVVITSFITFFQSIFQAFEKMEYLTLSKIAYSVSLVTIILLIIWQSLGVKALTGGYVYSALITLVTVLILTRKKFTHFWLEIDWDFWKKTLSEAWPFGLIGLLGSIYTQINIVQISLISGDIETGWYSTAYQFIFILTTLVGIFFSALFPTLSKEYGKSKTNFYNLVDFFGRKIIFCCFVLCLILFLTSRKIILLLYGPGYFNSINMLRILLISIFILFINTPYSEALRVMNYQKEYLKSFFWGVLLNFLLNFPLIYFWGGLGGAISTIFSSLLITALMLIKFQRFKTIDLG